MNTKIIQKHMKILKNDSESLLGFLKAKFPVFHNSNFFYRDFQYGIRSYLEKKNIDITYSEAAMLADELSKVFEQNGVFVKVNKTGWKINYPEFAATEPGDPF